MHSRPGASQAKRRAMPLCEGREREQKNIDDQRLRKRNGGAAVDRLRHDQVGDEAGATESDEDDRRAASPPAEMTQKAA